MMNIINVNQIEDHMMIFSVSQMENQEEDVLLI